MSSFVYKELETYDELKKKKIDVFMILKFHFDRIVTGINRKLTFKHKLYNPWTIEIIEFIAPNVFYEFYRAVRDYKIQSGFTAVTVKNKKKIPTEYILTFTHKGVFNFHIQQIKDVGRLQKTSTNGNVASVVITEESPAVFHYKLKGTLKVHLKYKVVNKYGNCVSY